MPLQKVSSYDMIRRVAALLKIAGIQSTITTNPATGMKFFSLFGDTFPIKDQLGQKGLGFKYFKGTWSMHVDKAKAIMPQLNALGIDTTPLTSEHAAPAAPAEPQAPALSTQMPAAPQTQTDVTLAKIKQAMDEVLKSGGGDDKTKRMLAFIDNEIDKVATSVDEAAKSEFIRSFLAFAARFHNYSFGNQMLIWFQRPDATYVSGFKQWMEKGRQVTNWGRPISIIRPQQNKKELSDQDLQKYNLGPDQRTRQWMSFKPAAVYDISDTSPIPGWKDKQGNGPFEPKSWRSDSNDAEEQITNLVKAANLFAQKMGINVDLEKELQGDLGGYSAGKEIAVNKNYKGINQFSTLAHELAHEILHRQDDQKMPTPGSRQEKEIDAETAAYIVLKHYGYESKDTPNYIALWRASGEAVKARRQNITKAVKIIIDNIDKEMGSVIEVGDENSPEAEAPVPMTPIAWVKAFCKFAAL